MLSCNALKYIERKEIYDNQINKSDKRLKHCYRYYFYLIHSLNVMTEIGELIPNICHQKGAKKLLMNKH